MAAIENFIVVVVENPLKREEWCCLMEKQEEKEDAVYIAVLSVDAFQ